MKDFLLFIMRRIGVKDAAKVPDGFKDDAVNQSIYAAYAAEQKLAEETLKKGGYLPEWWTRPRDNP